MKRLIMFLILGIFMINFTSALEWDNVQDYDPITKEFTITNALGFGKQIATIKLNTPLDYHVGAGYTKVAEFTINSNGNYTNALKKLDLYDIKNNMGQIQRQFDYKYLDYEEIEIQDYELECVDKVFANQSSGQVCNKVNVGSHIEYNEVWKDIGKDMVQGEITIGIFTNVEIGDKVEWIPTFFGEELTEWAVWTQDLSVDIVSYYKFDETSGPAEDFVGTNNGTVNTVTQGVIGKINNSYSYDGNDCLNLTNNWENESTLSFSLWLNITNLTASEQMVIFEGDVAGGSDLTLILRDENRSFFRTKDNNDIVINDSDIPIGEFVNFIMIADSINNLKQVWINGVLRAENSSWLGTANIGSHFTPQLGCQNAGSGPSDFYTGKIDEWAYWKRAITTAEVAQLYNGGAGISFVEDFNQPKVVLISPINNSNLLSQNINFIVNVTDESQVLNVTLFIDGLANQTNTSQVNGTYNFSLTLTDGSHNWSILAFDNESNFNQSETRIFSIDSIIPTIIIESPVGVLQYNRIDANETLNVTFTDVNLDTCSFDYNGTNITIEGCVTGVKNSTQFILEENNLNMTIYVNDTLGNENSTFISWDYKVLELNRTFDSSGFETQTKTFIINVSANSSLTSVNLIYDGLTKSTTLLNNISTLTFDIATSPGIRELLWSFSYAGEIINSTASNQTVNGITFDFCNATLTVPYINFTFKNETTNQEVVTATIQSSWNVWLGTGTETKAFTITNSTENVNYDICFSPSNKTINTNVSLNYNNVNSQQRSFVSEPILTNSTLEQTLFLLPTSLGLFSQFQTRDIVNNPISLVKGVITRTLDSSIVTVASFFTDSSGLVIYFLNPDVVYTATFSKTGFNDNAFTFVPTTDLRFVTMGSGVVVNGSNLSIGTVYEITPIDSTLDKNTLTTFGFNVTGNSEISLISMNITDGNGTSLSFASNAGTGFISSILNTSNNGTMTGIFIIETGAETLTISKVWIIGNEFEGNYSISKQGRLYLDYEFSDFIRLLMVILIIFGIVIFMSSNELADNNESKIAVVILLIWGFSVIGWLNNPSVVSTTGIAQFARQYGIAILSTGGAIFFFMRRLFI